MLVLEQIPMRQDNYSYALIKDQSVIMIDPSEPIKSLAFFQINQGLTLRAIINTHSHIDHVGGNEILWQKFRCPVYGPELERERVPCLSHTLKDEQEITPLGLSIKAYDVRAHTKGHIALLVNEPLAGVKKRSHHQKTFLCSKFNGHKVMFVGDSLFAAGCGRLFEGTPQDLLKSLSFYAAQDDQTLMACAHEYTATNLRFAHKIFPTNKAIKERLDSIDTLLANEGTSVPCTFALEKSTNPFLLALKEPYQSQLAEHFGVPVHDKAAILAQLRKAKDRF